MRALPRNTSQVMKQLLSLFLACVFISIAAVDTADACTPAINEEHNIAANPGDTQAPSIVGNPSYEVRDTTSGCGSDDCSERIMYIWVEVADDQSTAETIGFEFETISGDTPVWTELPTIRGRSEEMNASVSMFFHFGDDKPYSGTLRITPIDEAGNRGEAVELDINISDDTFGCLAASRRSGVFSLLFVVLALLFVRRRKTVVR